MAFVTIVDTEGVEHLIHTSMIGPPRPRWVSPDERAEMWRGVWSRVDAAKVPCPGEVFSPLAGGA